MTIYAAVAPCPLPCARAAGIRRSSGGGARDRIPPESGREDALGHAGRTSGAPGPYSAMTRPGSAAPTGCCCPPSAPRESALAGCRISLGIEHGGELALLGQEELDISALEAELREQIGRRPAAIGWPEPETERILRHPGAAPHP